MNRPAEVRHNHFTRDIKEPGLCPACNYYWSTEEGRSVQDPAVPEQPVTGTVITSSPDEEN